MRPLDITLADPDNGMQRRWSFVGEYEDFVARIGAIVGPAIPDVLYTLAIRSDAWGTLYFNYRNPWGPVVDDLQRASTWRSPSEVWTWWQSRKGDDTRLVEVIRTDTGEVVEVSEPFKGHASDTVYYALAVRSEGFGTLYVNSRLPRGVMTSDRKWALLWTDPDQARAAPGRPPCASQAKRSA